MWTHGHHFNETGFSEEAELREITSRCFGDKVVISQEAIKMKVSFQPNIGKK